jgi:hypothetical protein
MKRAPHPLKARTPLSKPHLAGSALTYLPPFHRLTYLPFASYCTVLAVL